MLIQMFLWFYVFPELLPSNLGRWVKRDWACLSSLMAIDTYGWSSTLE
ncbi:putative small integral membrane protein [Bradyrhizobium elkanii]